MFKETWMLQLDCGLLFFFQFSNVQKKFPCSMKSKRYYPAPKKYFEIPEIVSLIILTQAVYRIVSSDESLCIVSVLLPSFVIFV